MDYWGNCVLQGVRWGVDVARSAGVPVAMSGNPWHLVQLDTERFREVYFTPLAQNRHALHVSLARGPIDGLRELAARPALHQVRTPDGAVLCTVTAGPAYAELEALRSRTARRDAPSEATSR
jgi:hypothetical protein